MERAPCPVKDCRIPVDVVLRSRDKILIGAHQANLSGYSEGFPDADAISDASEPVDLTENAETLRILMHFVHKLQYPNVSLLKGDALFDLAVAAEKYMVLSAMSTCSLCIQFTVAKDPIRSLRYAVKHGYRDIADVAAPLTMYKSMETMKSGLGHDGALFAWLQYRTAYTSKLNKILAEEKPWPAFSNYHACPAWKAYKCDVVSAVLRYFGESDGKGFGALFEKPFKPCSVPSRCSSCRGSSPNLIPEQVKAGWLRNVATLIEDIPPLSSYM